MGIKKDLVVGSVGENLVTELFQKNNFSVEKAQGKFSDYDLAVTDNNKKIGDFSIEVKYDVYSKKSGNIAIEYGNPLSGKHTGINVTKADLWIHIVSDIVYITSTKLLRGYVDEYSPIRTIKNAGDGNASIYLYKVDEIVPAIFTSLHDLTDRKFRNVVKKLLEGD